jgi:hypothetical protein
MPRSRAFSFGFVSILCVALISPSTRADQANGSAGIGRWLTVSSNLDGGYRRTQFNTPDYNTGLFQWDGRVEVWPSRFPWGPYVRVAGIAGSEPNAWQNGWLGGPGLGIQVYPLQGVMGPLRVFGEYNLTRYWGEDFPGQGTSWRPRNQTRAGLEYWKAAHVNETDRYWWAETWNELIWQSANEFTNRYDSPIFGNAVRFGVRRANRGAISGLSLYLAAESSLSKYRHLGTSGCPLLPGQDSRDPENPCDFFWENGALGGGGVRYAPSLGKFGGKVLSRFVLYGEYLDTATYYGPAAPSSFPRFDVRVGLSANIGAWYK